MMMMMMNEEQSSRSRSLNSLRRSAFVCPLCWLVGPSAQSSRLAAHLAVGESACSCASFATRPGRVCQVVDCRWTAAKEQLKESSLLVVAWQRC